MRKLKNFKELLKEQEGIFQSDLTPVEFTKSKLESCGYDKDLKTLEESLESKPDLVSSMDEVYNFISEAKCTLLIVNNSTLLWDLHAYFPIMYALNEPGKSVYRTYPKALIDTFLNRSNAAASLGKKNHLCLISNIFFGDPRLASMSQSIGTLFEELIRGAYKNKRVLFSAPVWQEDRKEALKHVSYLLREIYSPAIENLFKTTVDVLFINKPAKIKDCWLED